MHLLIRSPPQQLYVTPSMLQVAPFPTENAMRAIMTTVGDLTTTVASYQAQAEHQIALLTQLV